LPKLTAAYPLATGFHDGGTRRFQCQRIQYLLGRVHSVSQ
jgi:hypothetical protein